MLGRRRPSPRLIGEARGYSARMDDKVKDVGKDVRDSAEEIKHRTIASSEHLKREALGHEMGLGEKIESAATEIKNRVEAEIDRVRRELRHDK